VAGNNLPLIEKLELPNNQSSALLGDELNIIGQNLDGLVEVRFTEINPSLQTPPSISLLPAATTVTGEGIKVTLPDDAAAHTTWVAGFYTVAVVVSRMVNGSAQTWSSNELPFSLAPRIETVVPSNPVRGPGDIVTVTVTCAPEIRLALLDPTHLRFAQQVMLLLGTARQIAPQPPPNPPPLASTDTLTFSFAVPAGEVGDYLVRLRVDGVDLVLVDRTVTPPKFDAKQTVTIT
jgi:hypothetical protein